MFIKVVFKVWSHSEYEKFSTAGGNLKTTEYYAILKVTILLLLF